MTAKLTVKQKRFCEEYIIDGNGTQAAIRAGYSKTGAATEGNRLLMIADIKLYIETHAAEQAKKTQFDAEWLLDHLGQIATAKISDILNDDWTYKPVSEWPLIWTQMINGLDIKQAINRNGEQVGEAIMSELSKIKIMDRNSVLDKIGKHISVQAFSETKATIVEGRTEAIAAALERGRIASEEQRSEQARLNNGHD